MTTVRLQRGNRSSARMLFPVLGQPSLLGLVAYPVAVLYYFVERIMTAALGERAERSFEKELATAFSGLVLPERADGQFEGIMAQCKEELVPLVVYLHAPNHGETADFVRKVLASEQFVTCVNDQGRFHADSIGARSGVLLEEALEVASYPFLAVIAYAQNRMQVIERIECGGKYTVEGVMGKLADALDRGVANLVEARRQRRERHESQSLREEQDAAFHASLKEDAEKARRERETKEEQQRLEDEKRRTAEDEANAHKHRMEALAKMRAALPAEPDAACPDACKIGVKLPNGTRLQRRFLKTDTLQMLHNFVATRDADLVNFTLNNCHPRRVHRLDHTFEEAKLVPSGLVMIHDLDA